MTCPTVALINNAQREHQEFMSSVQAVAQENGQVLHALSDEGIAVFPADDEFAALWQHMAGARTCLRFSLQADHGEVSLINAQWLKDSWTISAKTPQGVLNAQLHIAGRHNIANALAACAASLAAGVSLSDVAKGLCAFTPVKGRSRALSMMYQQREISLIDDTYNANPDSVIAAINVLAELPGPQILVLGDMGEVGDQGPAFHREVGAYALQHGLSAVLCLGELTKHTAQAAGAIGHHFDDIEVLKLELIKHLPQAGSVLVKGSRFMKMERLIDELGSNADIQKGQTPCC
jgi:UDP-N-acetylmuramoyl-tripeptide--D-alanyl-D-alanine ligase